MVSFEGFLYKYQRDISYKPFGALMVEDQTYGLFLATGSPGYGTWYHTDDEGVSFTEVLDDNNNSGFYSCYYDQANHLIYTDRPYLDGTKAKCQIYTIDCSDNSTATYGAVLEGDAANDDVYIRIITKIDGSIHLVGWHYDDSLGTYEIRVWRYNAGAWDEKDAYHIDGTTYFSSNGIVINDDDFYFIADDRGDDSREILKYNVTATTISQVETINNAYRLSEEYDQRSMVYDGGTLIYFPFWHIVSDTVYLWELDLDTDIASSLGEMDICFQAEDRCLGTTPYEFEKAYHKSNSNVYQLSRSKQHLHKLQNLGLTGGEVISGITDSYLITDTPSLWKYVDSLADFGIANGAYNSHMVPKGAFAHSTEFSSDQLIEIYQNNEGNYTLCFRGKLGNATYNQFTSRFHYRVNNLGYEDLQEKVSYSASATGIDEVVIALVGQLTNPYIYCDTTSVPNIATTMTYEFDDERLWDALYICCILGNAYWWVEPNGYLYFRAYSNPPDTGWYLGSGGINYETIGAITLASQMDWLDSITLYDGSLTLGEYLNHKNCLRLQDDATAGEDPYLYHTITQATSGLFEFYIGTTDVTQDFWFGLWEVGVNWIILLRINASKLYYYSSVPAWEEIQAVANDTLYHIQIQWYADNTFDVTVDEVLQVDGVANYQNQVSGVERILFRCFGDSTAYLYIDAPGLVGEVDPKNITYVEGYNDEDTRSDTAGKMSNPKVNKHQVQFNDFSNVRGGWNAAANSYFTPTTPTNAEHIKQYGAKLWTGRTLFSGAKTQASLDAIVTGLKAWQGMANNPVDATFLIKQYYYPVGHKNNVAWSINSLISTALDMLVMHNRTNFKQPGLIQIGCSTNIVRRG